MTALRAAGYRAVFFDAGYTLLRPHPSQHEVTAAALREAGVTVPADRLREALGAANVRLFGAHGRNSERWTNERAIREVWAEYYRALFADLDVPWDEALAGRIYDRFGLAESWALFDDVLPALLALASRGLRLGIVSDWGQALVPIVHAVGLGAHLGFVVVSAYAGVAKPDRDVFGLALARAGVRPEEAVHVGDSYVSDVLGARAAGIEPVLIDRDDGNHALDCAVIAALTDLPALIDDARKRARVAHD